MKKRKLLFWFIIIFLYLFSYNYQIKASYLQTTVKVYICGNNIIEGDEICDDGEMNGTYAFSIAERKCNNRCNGWAPYCGDGIIQNEYGEQCDDGNNDNNDGCNYLCQNEIPPSTTTTTRPPTGGGGGGGVPIGTLVTFSGKAYPKSTITLLKDAQIVATTQADDKANFFITLSNLTAGTYIFSLYSEDKEGNRSSLLTFPLSVTFGVTINVRNIFIAPTIDTDKIEVKKGDILKIFGQTTPDSNVTIIISSEEEIYKKVQSDESGFYLYNLDTFELEKGDHFAKSRATLKDEISPLSKAVSFKVGVRNILRPKLKYLRGDLNNDGRVNLIDFSIAAYWYKRPLSESFKIIEKERLNGDGKIDLVDFSIMAYYWTG